MPLESHDPSPPPTPSRRTHDGSSVMLACLALAACMPRDLAGRIRPRRWSSNELPPTSHAGRGQCRAHGAGKPAKDMRPAEEALTPMYKPRQVGKLLGAYEQEPRRAKKRDTHPALAGGAPILAENPELERMRMTRRTPHEPLR